MASETDFFPQSGEIAALIRSKDWVRTSLGPLETWSPSLRTILRLMLQSRYAMWMGWGPELRFFYNDAYARQTLGSKHPWALGRPSSEVWAEIWDTLNGRIQHVLSTGEATWDEGLLLLLERSGYPEETYHTFSYSPAPGDSPGEIGGLFCVVIEETERVIGERRIELLQKFAARLGQINSTAEVLAAAESCLSGDSRDIPFSLLYLYDDSEQSAARVLKGGFPESHPAAPERVSIAGGPWPFATLLAKREPLVINLPLDQAWPTGAWSKSPAKALLVPIAYQGQERPAGAFIAGINPHRPVDESFQSFVELFVGQLAAGLSNARAYAEEKRRADALTEVDRAKTLFFSNVSHEFRTPLTLMLGPTEDALGSPERTLRGTDLEIVHRNELRLLKLVNALLDFARIEAGRMQASYEATDLAALTTDLASSFRSAVNRAGLKFEVSCELSELVYVDHDMWEKIVLNLLSNALKFTFEGGISIALRLDGDRVKLSVRDTGVGIAASELPRLFERFHRIEGTRARTHEGSGIGLALVQDLVRLHGGSIEVASEVGVGTAFSVSIPRGAAHLPSEHISVTRGSATGSTGQAYVAEALRWLGPREVSSPDVTAAPKTRPRILVADDNADMRDYVTRLLGERWEVEAVSDGQAALDAIRASPPALVVCDVMMPRLDGFGLLRELRSDPQLRATPVILLSARAGEEAAAEGLNAGANDYIVKPFAARDLIVRVASRLAAAQADREADALKENLYRHFLLAPFMVAVFRGPDHVVELANRATLNAWGKPEKEAVGRPLLEAVPELRDQPFIGYLDQVFQSGVAYEGRFEAARLAAGPSGGEEEAYFSFVYAPLFDKSGTVEGVLMSAFDVTAQVRSRQEIERARDEAEELAGRLSSISERLRTAQRVARIGTFDWDVITGAMNWSPELFALMGLEPSAQLASEEAWNQALYDDSDRETGQNALREAVAERKPDMEMELRLRQPDGQSRWVRVSSEIQYDGAGKVARLLGAVVDVQLLKEAADARARALHEAERIGRAKDEFLATMSHELRTPLHAMLGWTKVLRRNRADEKKLEHGLAVIERNAETQARLISDLLDVSRIISGKLRLEVQKVSISAVIFAAIDVVREAAEAKGVRLIVNLDPDIGALLGDPDRLQQIVWNLLSNAVKFAPPRGSVTISSERSRSNVKIEVRDTGIGLSTEHLPLIFERFQQVDSTTTRAHGGLGLGLAIVRSLAEAHGGSVRALSEGTGKGATFVVTLPVRAVYTGEVTSEQKASPVEHLAGAVTDSELRVHGTRILVVEDDVDSLDLIRVVLERAGASVTAAPNALVGLQHATQADFDLVISDIGMPEMDGYSFIRRLRGEGKGTPAIALTAYARAEDAEQARRAGFQSHIPKPVDALELLASIQRLLQSSAS